MHRLRSRWTVFALVPAFFLAGFGIVSALADSDEPAPAAGPVTSSTETAGPGTVTVTGEAAPSEAPTAAEATTDEGAGGATTTAPGGGGGGGGGGSAPPAPPPGQFAIDYGEWDGMFAVENPEIQPEPGQATVFGELYYLGGLDCSVGLVRVKVWLYRGGSLLVGRTEWESTRSTGEGGEVTGREPLPLDVLAGVDQEPDAAAMRFTTVECL